MPHLIVPLSKSSWREGRIGPVEWQDWYRGFVRAACFARILPDSRIVVISDVRVAGGAHEHERYRFAAAREGVPPETMVYVRATHETIEQIAIAARMAKEQGAKLIIVSTWLHYPRVRWLARGVPAKHYAAFGIPRPYEAVTDIVMTFAMPVIDLLGLRPWFQRKTRERRQRGKL